MAIKSTSTQSTASGGEDFTAPSAVTAPGALQTTLTGLAQGQTYYVVVRAVDAAGNSDSNTFERRGGQTLDRDAAHLRRRGHGDGRGHRDPAEPGAAHLSFRDVVVLVDQLRVAKWLRSGRALARATVRTDSETACAVLFRRLGKLIFLSCGFRLRSVRCWCFCVEHRLVHA